MRNTFASEITALAGQDKNLVLLSGDIGNRLFNDFKDKYPQRFYNCGVAEANMTGMAAGLALCGMHPVTYTITPFATTRCMEQIRLDVCYQNLPVIIVGTGSGLSYAPLGATHHSLEDIAFLRSIPNMNVICPADTVEVRLALRAALKINKPVYIRLGKKGEPLVHQTTPEFIIGKGITVMQGDEICLLSTGNMLPTAMQAAQLLIEKGKSVQVVSMHTVKPLDEDLLKTVFGRSRVVVTIEEHSLLGGLGSGVAEWFVDHSPQKARLLRFGTADTFLHIAGSQTYARQFFGLTPQHIAEKVLSVES
jgi:transketolase